MTELTHADIDAVAGANMDDVYVVGAAAVAGALIGSAGGPVGSVAMAVSFAGHALLIRLLD